MRSLPLRILLVDDDDRLRESLARHLGTDPGTVVVGEAANGNAALKILDRCLIDVVVSDIRMPGMDGFELLDLIKTRTNPPAFVAMTAHDRDEAMTKILNSGAQGYIVKGDRVEEIRRSIYAAAEGGTTVSPMALSRLLMHVRHATDRPTAPDTTGLNPTTARVLDLVCIGRSNKQIGETLGLTLPKVKKHVSVLFAFFNVASRSELIVHMHRPAR